MAITIKKNAAFILLLIILLSNSVSAGVEIKKFTPSISTELIYTDNVNLTSTNKESDTVFRVDVNPFPSGISTQGSRLRTQLDYTISGLSYSKDNNLNDLNHNLSATAEAEIVKNAVFLDAYANTRGVLLDQNKSASSDRVSGSENLTDTYTYGLTTSWNKNWGNYASSDFSYDYNEVKFGGGSSESNSTGNSINLVLASGSKFNRYFWDLNYNHDETSYDNDSPDTTTDTSYVTLGYHYTRSLDLRVRLGFEDYDDSVDDGFGWTVGGNWHPNPRTTLDASWGERAFGRTAFLDFSHKHKRSTWQVNYSDEITNSRGQLIANSQSINDINANPDDNQNANSNNIDVPLATYNPNLRLTRRLTGSTSFQYTRSSFTLRLYAERLYYDDADNKDNDNYGTSLDWGYRLGGKTSMNTRLFWDKSEDLGIANKQNTTGISWYLNRTLSPTFTARIGYDYTNNDADLKSSEYDENRITASISKTFR